MFMRAAPEPPMADSALLWFRRDLRLADNPALAAAVAAGGPVVPVYIWAPEDEGTWAPGAASRWWLHDALAALEADLAALGARLVLRAGPARETLGRLLEETGAAAVYWNRLYEPSAVARDRAVKQDLRARGLGAHSFNGALLVEPADFLNKSGEPYKVFTPFWKAASRETPETPCGAPTRWPAPESWPESTPLDAMKLKPRIDWAEGLRDAWTPGETSARGRLDAFVEALRAYPEERDHPGAAGVSRLSPHLHFGEISPRTVRHAVAEAAATRTEDGWMGAAEAYIRQLYWREFAHSLLYHFPDTPEAPLRPGFARFPWREDKALMRAWRRGRTGYPLVDAGMRALWRTGWMHNRVRMVVGSFLVKHLLQPWQDGAAWFWDTLVDADLANNTLGWQWTAGCGADAAPYFRIFNPVAQGERFDAYGTYVRQWVPELAALPDAVIHKPWTASPGQLEEAGVRLGDTYPHPIVDHAKARARALEAYETIKKR